MLLNRGALAFWIPLLGALLLFAVGEFILSHALDFSRGLVFSFDPQPGPCTDATKLPACMNFAKLGYTYAALWLLLTVVSVAAIVVSIGSLRLLSQETQRGAFIVATVLGLVVAWLAVQAGHVYEAVGKDVFSWTVGALGQLGWLRWSIAASNVVVGFAAAFVGTACCAMVLDLPADKPTNASAADEQAARLENRMQSLRLIVLFGALLLVAGIATMAAYLAWPTAFMKNDKGDSPYGALTNGIVTLHGVSYSLVLFILFCGPAGVLYGRLQRIAREVPCQSETGVRAFLAKHQLTPSLPSFLANALTIAAPLLTSQLTQILKLLPSG
jgi:hypothetical protein